MPTLEDHRAGITLAFHKFLDQYWPDWKTNSWPQLWNADLPVGKRYFDLWHAFVAGAHYVHK